MEINKVLSVLYQMASLRSVKIATIAPGTMNGSQWEDLIKTKLLFLNKFELCSKSACHRRSEGETAESVLNEMIAPFYTPFWTEEK